MRTFMRRASVALAATLVVSAESMPAHGQSARDSVTLTLGVSGTPAQNRMFDVYQGIFALLFFTGGIASQPGDAAGWAAWPGDDVRNRVIAFFKSIGLDEAAANILFVHVRDGLVQQEMYSRQWIVHLCQRKSDITSKAQFAEAFADLYGELDRMQERFWGSFEMLDPGDRELLSAYAKQRAKGMQIHPTDAATIRRDVEQSSETLADYLGRACPET